MPENLDNSGSGKLTVSEKLEMIWNLSKAARDRFNVRNQTEWKICFGLWTAFGVAAGFVVNSSSWKPNWEVFNGTVAIVLLIVVVFGVWTFKRREFDETDSRTAYFWESAIEEKIEITLPTELHPGKKDNKWLRSGEVPVGTATGEEPLKPKPKYDYWHPGFWGEITITLLFGFLVIGAVAHMAGQTNEGKLYLGITGTVLFVILVIVGAGAAYCSWSKTKNSNTVGIEKRKVDPQK